MNRCCRSDKGNFTRITVTVSSRYKNRKLKVCVSIRPFFLSFSKDYVKTDLFTHKEHELWDKGFSNKHGDESLRL